MRIQTPEGYVRNAPFSPANCVGYVAEIIGLDADDVKAMRKLAHDAPREFQIAMLQLEGRFPSRRAGGK